MSNLMYDSFNLYFPLVAEDVVSYKEVSNYEIVVKLSNGNSILFDYIDKTIRMLPRDSNAMTEDECRHEFGTRLRRLMFYKNITQNELSELTGIAQPLLSRYITGATSPSFYTVDKIAKALGCSTDDLRYID